MRNLPRNQTPDIFVQEFGDLLCASIQNPTAHADRHDLIAFGEYLLAARTMLALSRCDFAHLVGTTEARIYALEVGLLPRTAISDRLLQRIATTIEEDYEILAIILGDRVALPPRPRVAAALSWCSALLPPERLRRFRQVGKLPQTLAWSGHNHFLHAITWITLLYSRSHNLLDCLQAGRLLSRIAPKPLALLTAACCCFVLWLALNMDRPFLSTAGQGTTTWTAEDAGLSPTRIVQPVAASPVQHSHRDQPSVALVSTEPLASSKATVTNDAYRIIYVKRSATRQLSAAAYLTVNEEQFAMIEFRATTSSRWRCITSGKFDLCPI